MTNEERAREAAEKFGEAFKTMPAVIEVAMRDHIYPILLTALNAATAELEEERGRLREALRPFADEAERYDPDEGDDRDVAWVSDFPIGALRRARSAIAKKDPSDG